MTNVTLETRSFATTEILSVKHYDSFDSLPKFPCPPGGEEHRIQIYLTNACDNQCPWCVTASEQHGPEIDFDDLCSLLECLRPRTKVCFMGGNVFNYRLLAEALTVCLDKKLKPGLLINEIDFIFNEGWLEGLEQENMLDRLLVSVQPKLDHSRLIRYLNKKHTMPVDINFIPGINTLAEFVEMNTLPIHNINIHVFEHRGRGEKYYDCFAERIKANESEWEEYLTTHQPLPNVYLSSQWAKKYPKRYRYRVPGHLYDPVTQKITIYV